MMMIGGRGTRTVRADADYEQPGFVGNVGETTFFADDIVTEALRHGATVTVDSAMIGNTAVAPSAISFDDDTGVVTLDGLPRPIRDASDPVRVTFQGVENQTMLDIRDATLLDAISAAQTITITAGSLTTADGNTRTLVPANDLRIEGTELIVTNPEYVDQRYRLSITATIPAYTTAGIPITRANDESGRIVRITYDISSYDLVVENLHPADQCVWEQEEAPSGNGYLINNATFYTGSSDSNGAITQDITNPRLGYIGKSGRFVAITDSH